MYFAIPITPVINHTSQNTMYCGGEPEHQYT